MLHNKEIEGCNITTPGHTIKAEGCSTGGGQDGGVGRK